MQAGLADLLGPKSLRIFFGVNVLVHCLMQQVHGYILRLALNIIQYREIEKG